MKPKLEEALLVALVISVTLFFTVGAVGMVFLVITVFAR